MPYSTRVLAASLAAAVLALGLFGTAGAQSKPKYNIKTIMKYGLKGGLAKKVVGGEATGKEKIQLLDYAIALYENKPKKGDAASWTKLTGDLVTAAAKSLSTPGPAPRRSAKPSTARPATTSTNTTSRNNHRWPEDVCLAFFIDRMKVMCP